MHYSNPPFVKARKKGSVEKTQRTKKGNNYKRLLDGYFYPGLASVTNLSAVCARELWVFSLGQGWKAAVGLSDREALAPKDKPSVTSPGSPSRGSLAERPGVICIRRELATLPFIIQRLARVSFSLACKDLGNHV